MKAASNTGNFHAVRFYQDADSLCRIVGEFLSAGLTAGEPAIVIATSAHRDGIVKCLEARSIDARSLESEITLLDAETVLSQFMVDGMPDAARFTATITPIIERACRGRQDCVVRAYGEMVDVLWKAGQTVAATRVEVLWNDLARTTAFSLLCGYAMGSFYKSAAVGEICRHHSHIMSESGDAVTVH